VVANYILGFAAWVIDASWFLALAKPSNGTYSIAVGKCFIVGEHVLIISCCVYFLLITISIQGGGYKRL
jgi:hypothetical protein